MSPECLFCKIAHKRIPSDVLAESDAWIAFRDVRPQAPFHALIVPKKHLTNLLDAGPQDAALLGQMWLELARIAREHGFAESGFRVVNNCNGDGGQTVGHLHLHLLGGRPLGWPPG